MGVPEGAAPDPRGACVLAEPAVVPAEPVLPAVVAVDAGLELLLHAPRRPTAAQAAAPPPSLVRAVQELLTLPPLIVNGRHGPPPATTTAKRAQVPFFPSSRY